MQPCQMAHGAYCRSKPLWLRQVYSDPHQENCWCMSVETCATRLGPGRLFRFGKATPFLGMICHCYLCITPPSAPILPSSALLLSHPASHTVLPGPAGPNDPLGHGGRHRRSLPIGTPQHATAFITCRVI